MTWPRELIAVLALVSACRCMAGSGAAGPVTVAVSREADAARGACPLPLSEVERARRVEWARGELARWLRGFERRWATPDGGVGCPSDGRGKGEAVHDWGDYALAKAVMSGGDDPAARAMVEAALGCLFALQSRAAEGAPERGVFPFHVGDPLVARENPTEFALEALASPALQAAVSPDARRRWRPRVEAALDAIERHPVCPGYTNICLMQIAEELSLGAWIAATGDARALASGAAYVASGQRRLAEWSAFTRDAGITEYDSPTYAQVDLDSLLLALSTAPDGAARSEARAALDYVWSDLSSSFFPGREGLGGAESRTYDLFQGRGGVGLSLYLEGLRSTPPDRVGVGPLSLALQISQSGRWPYHPPASALCLASEREHVVLSTFGPHGGAGGRQRYAFLSPDFTLSGVSADYGASLSSDQDLPIRAQLRSSPGTSDIVILPDYLDAPGSSVKAGDFVKVTHLRMSPVVAQRRGALLALLAVPAGDPGYRAPDGRPLGLVSLSTNVIVPADADELRTADGAVVRDRAVPLGPHPTLAVRIGQGVLAVGVVDAGGLDCEDPAAGFSPEGSATAVLTPLAPRDADRGPTLRLAVYHATVLPSDTSRLAACVGRTALLLVGDRCADSRCAEQLAAEVDRASRAATRRFDAKTGEWNVRVDLAGRGTLHVRRVVGSKAQILARDVDGVPMSFSPLEVDGRRVVLGG